MTKPPSLYLLFSLLPSSPFPYFYPAFQDGKWTLAGDFGNAGVSLEGIESSEKNEQAKKLYNYAVRQSIQGNALKTDENGIAMIGGLEQGLYLIAQTKVWTDEKQGSYQASPYLISIPEEIDGSYIWDVVTKPKSEWITEAPQHPEMPDIMSVLPVFSSFST